MAKKTKIDTTNTETAPVTPEPTKAPKAAKAPKEPKAPKAKKAEAPVAEAEVAKPKAKRAPKAAPAASADAPAVKKAKKTHIKKNEASEEAHEEVAAEEEHAEESADSTVADESAMDMSKVEWSTRKFPTYTLPMVKALVEQVPEYHKLSAYLVKAKKFHEGKPTATNKTKIRVIEQKMKQLIEAGGVTVQRRIPGTGEPVVITKKYVDTLENRAAGRVGNEYTITRWTGAQYETVAVTKLPNKKRKRAAGEGEEEKPKKKTAWTDALTRAHQDLGIGNQFVAVYKTLPENATEAQQLGHKLYNLTRKYLEEGKAAKAAEAPMATEAPAMPMEISAN